jgi:large subunit ribosomal protein L22
MKESNIIEAKSILRFARISPSKVRRILNQIKGRPCNEAILILKFMPYKACSIINKVLLAAISNAKQQSSEENISFFIKDARADTGPFLKRFRPHAQGRGFPIKKHMSHITSMV